MFPWIRHSWQFGIPIQPGEACKNRSDYFYGTVSVYVAVCVAEPDVPVITMEYVPFGVPVVALEPLQPVIAEMIRKISVKLS